MRFGCGVIPYCMNMLIITLYSLTLSTTSTANTLVDRVNAYNFDQDQALIWIHLFDGIPANYFEKITFEMKIR